MGGWGLFHMSIHIELVINLLTHRQSLDEDFEHNITMVTKMIGYQYLRWAISIKIMRVPTPCPVQATRLK